MKKVGIFGGTFNPVHQGHINSVQSVSEKLNFDEVHVIPAFQSPGRSLVLEVSPEDRFHMTEMAFEDYGAIKVIDEELKRGGISYTVDTVSTLKQRHPDDELHLILGLDQFQNFDSWKDSNFLLDKINLVVTSRPGFYMPMDVQDFPENIARKVESFDGNQALLQNGRMISFFRLKDVDISATEVRRRLILSQSVDAFLPLCVEQYIKEKKLYILNGPRIKNYKAFTKFCYDRLTEKQAFKVLSFDLTKSESISDYTLIASASNRRQTQSLGERLIVEVKENFALTPATQEGFDQGNWVVIDFGALIVHIFYDYFREEYRLEELWGLENRISWE